MWLAELLTAERKETTLFLLPPRECPELPQGPRSIVPQVDGYSHPRGPGLLCWYGILRNSWVLCCLRESSQPIFILYPFILTLPFLVPTCRHTGNHTIGKQLWKMQVFVQNGGQRWMELAWKDSCIESLFFLWRKTLCWDNIELPNARSGSTSECCIPS